MHAPGIHSFRHAAPAAGLRAWLTAALLAGAALLPAPEVRAADADSIIDVPTAILMRIYRGEHKDGFRHRVLDNLELGFHWNPEALWNHAQYQGNAMGFGATLSKDLTPSHTLRLGFNFAMPKYDNPVYGDPLYMRRHAIDLGWLWNLSNFYGGYDLSRANQWMLSLGASTAFTKPNKGIVEQLTDGRHDSWALPGEDSEDAASSYQSWGGYLGLQFRRALSPRLALYVEPQLRVMGDNYDGGTNESRFDVGAAAQFGAAYRLTPSFYRINESERDAQGYKIHDNYFFQLMGGLTTSLSANALPQGFTELSGKGGSNLTFALGRWLGRGYGARLAFAESTYKYALDGLGNERYTQLRGGRAEFLIDPVRLFSRTASLGRLGFDVSAGIEAGVIKKHRDGVVGYETVLDDEGNPHDGDPIIGTVNPGNGYFGLTAGGQLKWFVNRWSAFFVEGRYSRPRYLSEDASFSDGVFSLDAGLEVYRTNFARYTSDRREPRKVGQDLRETWFVEYGGGISHAVHAGENFRKLLDPQVSFAIGRRMDPYSSVRARLEATFLDENEIKGNKPANMNASLSLDYMLTLTNTWMGLDPQRHVDLRLVLGQLLLMEGLSDFDLGYELGVQASHRVSPNWELYLEPRYQVLYSFPSRWDLGAGATYTFVKRPRKQKLDLSRWYIQFLTGAELFSIDLQGKQVNHDFHKIGSFDFAIGRQMDPVWSLRAGLFASEIEVQHVNDPAAGLVPQTSQYVGGRLEAQFNLLRSFSRKLEDSRWNIAVMAGAEGGHITNAWEMDEAGNRLADYHTSFGFTMAGQLQYRLTRYGWLIGQMRAQQLSLDHTHLVLSSQLGVQYDLYNRKRIDMRRPKHRWYFGGGVGWMNGHIGTVDVFVGDWFTPNHGARVSLTFADSPLRNMKFDLHHWPSVAADYTMHLSNMIFGIDDERYIDFQLLAGPELTYHSLREVAREGKFGGMNWHLGMNWGAHITGHIAKGVSFYVEPRFTYMPTDNLTTLDHERVNLFATAGLQLEMNPYGKGRRWMERDDRNYFQLKADFQPWNVYDRGLKGVDGCGVGATLTYGHWFNDIVGMELSGYYDKLTMFGEAQKAFGGRPELAIDLTSAMNPDWRRKPFMLVGTVGINAGRFESAWRYSNYIGYYEFNEAHDEDYRRLAALEDPDAAPQGSSVFRVSPTMALQLRYRPAKSRVSLSLGMRFTEYNYQVPVPSADGTTVADDRHFFMPVSLNTGILVHF